MNRVCFPIWSESYEEVSNIIYCVSDQIKSSIKLIKSKELKLGSYKCNILSENIEAVLKYWTGCTYVGCKKDKIIQKAFQSFFINLYNFLMTCKTEENILFAPYKEFANRALYQGKIYRYLGHGDDDKEYETKVAPIYNDIYVSWSKKAENSYLQSKLYGPKTLLTCEITDDYYGIDLDVFGVVKGDEAEVVFPTIKELITDIKYE